jgi:hypothetical protein
MYTNIEVCILCIWTEMHVRMCTLVTVKNFRKKVTPGKELYSS